jgi:hypothetical protein
MVRRVDAVLITFSIIPEREMTRATDRDGWEDMYGVLTNFDLGRFGQFIQHWTATCLDRGPEGAQ